MINFNFIFFLAHFTSFNGFLFLSYFKYECWSLCCGAHKKKLFSLKMALIMYSPWWSIPFCIRFYQFPSTVAVPFLLSSKIADNIVYFWLLGTNKKSYMEKNYTIWWFDQSFRCLRCVVMVKDDPTCWFSLFHWWTNSWKTDAVDCREKIFKRGVKSIEEGTNRARTKTERVGIKPERKS